MTSPLWPDIPNSIYISGLADVTIYKDPKKEGKPILKIVINDERGRPVTIYTSVNVAEMIGGAAVGAIKILEDHNK